MEFNENLINSKYFSYRMNFIFPLLLLVLSSGFVFGDVFGATTERGEEFATLEIQDVGNTEWLEGQQLTVTLTDGDMNKDPTVAEKILFPTAYDIVFEEHPTLDPAEFLYKKLGSMPSISTTNLGLRYETNAMFDSTVLNRIQNQGYVDEAVFFSNLEIPVNTGSVIFFENAIKYSEITQFSSEPNLKHFINYDVSSLTQNLASGEITSITITLEDDYESVILVDSTSNFQNYFLIDNSKILEIKNNLHTDVNDDTLDLKITLEGVQPNTKYEPKTNLPFAFDVFRFGSTGLAESLDSFVLEYTFRWELEETGVDTGVFTGTIAYERITAKNIDTFDYSQLDTFGKDIIYPTFPDATDEHRVRINYFDFGQDGVTTLVADQQALLSLAEIPDITITTDEDVPVSFPLGVDDITISYDNSPNHTPKGVLTQNGLEFTYTPRDDIFGTDEIQLGIVEDMFGNSRNSHLFNIIITITNVNDTPLAGNDVQSTTNEDTITAITLIGQDVDGDSLTYSVVTNPTDGTLSGTSPNLSYSPNPDFHGTDSFTFKVNDGTVDSSIDTATITISPINDIPIANAGSDQSVNPSTSVTLDGSQSSDVDGDSVTYSWIQTSGTPVTLSDDTIVNPQLSTPSSENTLSFMLTVSDGTATSNPDVVNIYIGTPVPDPIPPPPPLALSTTSLNGSVNLSWQPPADDGGETISDYIIEFKKESDTTWEIHDDGTSSTTTTIISGLTNNDNYQFRISSVSLAGVGDTSSVISEIPVGIITEDVEPTVETTTEPTVETTTEPTVELSTETVEPKKILSFVDESKEPESYVDRYINEPSYKEWFDSNYSDYTIYEGIGITEDEYLVIVASLEQPVPESLETKEIEEPIVIDNVDLPVVTTPQENTEVKTETVIQDDEPLCGAGTEENSKGQCVPIKSSPTQKSGGGCLIATSTYGSELAPQVQQLRELRDNSLLVTKSGTNFMSIFNDVYYSFSPIIADYERENPVFKEMVKVAITPMISSLSILNYVDMDSEGEVIGYGISLIVLNLAMYVGIPASVIIGIKKTRN